MNEVKLIIYGTPKGKDRPKFTKSGRAYTPKETADYENEVQTLYRMMYGSFRFAKDVPLDLRVRAFYRIPKSDSRVMREKKLNNVIRPCNIKPDIDNVVKIVCDALNKTAFDDDTQIVDIQARKFYSNNPRIEILLKEAETKKG